MKIFSPVGQAVCRRAGLSSRMADVCESSFTVGTPINVERRPAVFIEGELDRVIATAPFRTMHMEVARLSPGEYRVPAAVGYELRNALFIDGNIYKGLAKHTIAGETKTLIAVVREETAGGCIVANRQSDLYFGHWLSEELPATSAAAEWGPILQAHHGRAAFAHEAGYYGLYGIPKPLPIASRCSIPRLTLLSANPGLHTQHLQGMSKLKQVLFEKGWVRTNERVFIRRGGGAARSLTNEMQIVERLIALGFTVVDPESMAPEDIARECFDAKLVVGVEGSHLAHAFMQMSPGASMIVIQPPARFNNPFKDLCDARGLRYGFVVAEADGTGFSLATDRLLRTIDLLPS